MKRPMRSYAAWVLAALLVLAFCAGMTAIGGHFEYGQGHAERPIPLFLALYGMGWLGFAAGCALVWRGRGNTATAIVIAGLCARALIAPSNLIQENDCYRYVLDGESVLHGVNPYALAPGEVMEEAPAPLKESVHTERAQQVLSRISYGSIPTIYPPLAQAAFAIGAFLTPWHWYGQRIVFSACDVATLFVLLHLLKLLGKNPAWIVFYAWNPLILKEVVNAAHLDSLAALCILLAVWALTGRGPRRAEKPSGQTPVCCANRRVSPGFSQHPALAGAAMGAAVLAKLYPLLLVPACFAFLYRKRTGDQPGLDGRNRAAVFGFVLLATVVLGYLPFLDVGPERLTEGLRTYGAEWQRNDGAFRLIAALVPDVEVSAPGDEIPGVLVRGLAALLNPRTVVAAVVGLFALAMAWRLLKHPETGDGPVFAFQATLLVWFLFLPAAYPWYAVPLLALSTLRPRLWAVVLSGAFSLYYLLFLVEYRDCSTHWKLVVQAVEHGLVWLALAIPLVLAKSRNSWFAD